MLRLVFVVALCLLQGSYGASIEQTNHIEVDDPSAYEFVAAIGLLVCMISMLALCAGDADPGVPLPNWVYTCQVDPAIDTGYTGSSDGINIINNNCVHRHRKGVFETDGAKWGAPLSKGKHLFEITWPKDMRGTMATIGVGTDDAPLFVKPKDSLVGCNAQSWGLDIARRRLIHKGAMLGNMPKGVVPDKVYMYVNCDGGTLGFGCDQGYWGAPINIPRQNFPVYAMIGTMHWNSQITMIYRGSETKGGTAPAQQAPQAMVVGNQGPSGETHVVVVDPNTVKT